MDDRVQSPERFTHVLRRGLSEAAAAIPGGFWRHQGEAVDALRRHFESMPDRPNAIVVIPTGGGKTEVFSHVLEHHQAVPGASLAGTFVLVPTRTLVVQTVRRLTAQNAGIDVHAIGRRAVPSDGGVNVMTYARFVKLVQGGALSPGEVGLLVLDEAHRGLSERRRRVFARFDGTCPILAFSATPAYDVNKSIYALLGRQSEVVNVPAARLRDEGIITQVVNYVLAVSIKGGLPDDPRMRGAVLRQAANMAMLEFRREHLDPRLAMRLRDKVFIGYHADVAQARAATELQNADLAVGELPSAYVSGRETGREQSSRLDGLRAGLYAGLNNALLLVEGTDVPNVGAVLNFYPTESLVKQIQRCGRAMRIDPDHPVDHPSQTSIVVDLYFEVDGVIQGKPRFYFEAIGDESIVREARTKPFLVGDLREGAEAILADPDFEPAALAQSADAEEDEDDAEDVDTDAVDTEAVEIDTVEIDTVEIDTEATPPGTLPEAGQPDPGSGSAPARDVEGAGFRYSSDVASVRYLLARRDRRLYTDTYAGWQTKSALRAALKLDVNNPLLISFFDSVEDEIRRRTLSGETGNLVLERPGGRIVARLEAGLVLNRYTPVYAPESIPTIARSLDCTDLVKDADWMTRSEICGSTGIQEGKRLFFDGIEEEFLAKRRTARLDHEPVARRPDAWKRLDARPSLEPGALPVRMDLVRSGKVPIVCYHRDSWDLVRKASGVDKGIPAKEEGWLFKRQASEACGFASSLRIRNLLDEVYGIYALMEPSGYDEREVPHRGETFRVRRAAYGEKSQRPTTVIHRDSVPALLRAAGIRRLEKQTEDWLNNRQCAAKLGTTHLVNERFRRFWDGLVSQCAAGGPIMVAGEPIRFEMRLAGRQTEIGCVHVDDVPTLGRHLGLRIDVPAKTAEWTSAHEAMTVLGKAKGRKEAIEEVFARIGRELGNRTEATIDIGGRKARIALRRIHFGPAGHIHRDDLGVIAELVGGSVVHHPVLEDDWYPYSRALRTLGMGTRRQSLLTPVWESLAAALDAGDPPTVAGRSVEAGWRRTRGREKVLAVPFATLEVIAECMGRPSPSREGEDGPSPKMAGSAM